MQLELDAIPNLGVRDLNIVCQTVHDVAAVQTGSDISARHSSAKEVPMAYVDNIDMACTVSRRHGGERMRYGMEQRNSPLLLAMWKDTQTILGRKAKYCAGHDVR